MANSKGAPPDALRKARDARKAGPWSLKDHMEHHVVFEAERIAALVADERANPQDYCKRSAPLPADGVCGHCFRVDTLYPERLDYFIVWTCQICGMEYYPDTEPIPLSDTTNSAGRHHSVEPGAHYQEYDSEYRRTRKGKKNATT